MFSLIGGILLTKACTSDIEDSICTSLQCVLSLGSCYIFQRTLNSAAEQHGPSRCGNQLMDGTAGNSNNPDVSQPALLSPRGE